MTISSQQFTYLLHAELGNCPRGFKHCRFKLSAYIGNEASVTGFAGIVGSVTVTGGTDGTEGGFDIIVGTVTTEDIGGFDTIGGLVNVGNPDADGVWGN